MRMTLAFLFHISAIGYGVLQIIKLVMLYSKTVNAKFLIYNQQDGDILLIKKGVFIRQFTC